MNLLLLAIVMESSTEHDSSLRGLVIQSDVQPGVRYRLVRRLGEGAMGVAYLAQRESKAGSSPVVIKAVHPHQMVKEVAPELLARKEAVALGRLNDRLPPSPFVVRFIDTGNAKVFGAKVTPWLALEYVHGGVEGTTLDERVTYSIQQTKYAFDAVRAAHAVRCLTAGLTAIHGVDVIHRDLTPGNVLCCGFGETEIFKVSDFGLARPTGLDRTFGEIGVGTIGYAAPEQIRPDKTPLRPYTDVFALACVTYYLLTGSHYFEGDNPLLVYNQMLSQERPSILDSPLLSPELRERARGIDRVLAASTSAEVKRRPATAERFAFELLGWLTEEPSAPRSSRRLMSAMLRVNQAYDPSGWSWTVRQLPQDDLVIRSAAWDADGHCVAVTNQGVCFWNGDTWRTASVPGIPDKVLCAQRHEAGGWLLGGKQGQVVLLTAVGVHPELQIPEPDLDIVKLDIGPDGLLIVVANSADQPPSLLCRKAGRWLRPLPLDGVAYLSSVVRYDRERWLIGGRLEQGSGFVADYAPLQRAARVMPTPETRAFVAGSGAPERQVALMVGASGAVWRVSGKSHTAPCLAEAPDLTAAAVDLLDREWVASPGTLWSRDSEPSANWRRVWHDSRWQTPFVSLTADAGMIVAMTADGGIIEGRDSVKNYE